MTSLDSEAIENFREYLRIPSIHPDVDYEPCVSFLSKQASSLGLPVETYIVSPKKPVVIITWVGTQPQLPSVLLNSHMDVVPVFRDKWTHDPFGAERDAQGNIYARGSQDMKCVGIQYIETIRRLIKSGVKLKRTVHMSFVPDEEIGGLLGMGLFVKTNDFKKLNVGCALDEGIASPTEEFLLYNGERSIWHLHIHCPGTPGHGSLLLDNTAGEKVNIVIQKFMERRSAEKKKLKDNPNLTIGDVTTINLTMLQGGVQSNVVPPEMVVGFDCRLSVDTDHEEFEAWANDICRQAGEGTWIEFEQKQPKVEVTKLDSSNPWWGTYKSEFGAMDLKLKVNIFPGGTDSRYIRELGIPAFGFSPMNNTPVRLHDHDEFLNEKVFLRGIQIYSRLIPAIANL